MLSTKKIMLSKLDNMMQLADQLEDMGELRLIRKKVDGGNEIVYLREQTNFEAFKDWLFGAKAERNQQKTEAIALIAAVIQNHALAKNMEMQISQTVANIRTVVQRSNGFTGRSIAEQLKNFANNDEVNPLADGGIVAFPKKSFSLFCVGPERVAADHALMRFGSLKALPDASAPTESALNYLDIIPKSGQPQTASLHLQPFGDPRVAAPKITVMPELRRSSEFPNASRDAVDIEKLFGQALAGKSGRVVIEPLPDASTGYTDEGLKAMLKAVGKAVAESPKDQGRKSQLRVMIAVSDKNLYDRIKGIADVNSMLVPAKASKAD